MEGPSRLFDILERQLARFPRPDALAYKYDGQWRMYSTQEVVRIIRELAAGLIRVGIAPDDKVAIVSYNRPEWNFIDQATQRIGGVLVPLYPTASISEWAYILKDAGARILFVESDELLQKAHQMKESHELPQLTAIYRLTPGQGAAGWETLRLTDEALLAEVDKRADAVEPDQLATLIYTSGTTGDPKGVMLTHANILSNIQATAQVLPLYPSDKALSFLPLCHSFERMVSYYYIYQGVGIWYAEHIDKIGDNLREVRPTVFTTVPRLLEKVYERIVSVGMSLSGLKRAIFFWAHGLGINYEYGDEKHWWKGWQLKVVNKLVFAKWREALGGNVRFIVSGGAALQERLARIFTAAGIPVLEGYGLTETSPVIAVNQEDVRYRKFGTVGPPIPNVEVRIADDGEILCKGPNVMKGYYNKPEATAEVFDKEGWFHTGDIGRFEVGMFVKDKIFLKIVDRKKELFKTSGGKYVAPQPIENRLKESFLIDNAWVVGENRKFVSAIIIPSMDNLKEWAEQNGILVDGEEALLNHPRVLAKYEEIIRRVNDNLSRPSQIKKFRLRNDQWGVDTGEMTPTLKLKRRVLEDRYRQLIEEIYWEDKN